MRSILHQHQYTFGNDKINAYVIELPDHPITTQYLVVMEYNSLVIHIQSLEEAFYNFRHLISPSNRFYSINKDASSQNEFHFEYNISNQRMKRIKFEKVDFVDKLINMYFPGAFPSFP